MQLYKAIDNKVTYLKTNVNKNNKTAPIQFL